MAIKGFMESSLTTSEIFQTLNTIDGSENISQKALNLIKSAERLTNEDIEASYIQVKQITDTLTRAALRAYDSERIILLYNNNPSLSVSQGVPFITYLSKSKGYTTYVFMDKYVKISRDGIKTLAAPVLRDLLTGALVSNGLKTNYDQIAASEYMQKILMEIYTKLVTRIINRQFAIAADKISFDVVQYWVNKFFLNKILGANNLPENIEQMSKAHFKFVDDLKYDEIKQTYEMANPSKFSELLDVIKTASPRMKSLNMGTFMSDWFNYYYPINALAPDTLEYLIFMIITLLSGNNLLVNINASDIVKDAKTIKSFRGELLKIVPQ